MAGMQPHKILLYYIFRPLGDPQAISLWQRKLCESLDLRGRILVSEHGINGTVGGEIENLLSYIKQNKEYPSFREIEYKWSEGHRDDFPRLKVKARSEVVGFGIPHEIKVDAHGIVGGGQHLSPVEVHELVEARGSDVTFFDGRNAFESRIGRFTGAVIPETNTTHDFIAEIDSGKYDHLKSKPIVTYCTGGIRCEILSSAMKSRGFEEVYQLDGGIVKYGEAFGNKGLWEGSLYVFDRRMAVDFEENVEAIGECAHCDGFTKTFYNCSSDWCRELTLVCDSCVERNVLSLDCIHV
jgi:UPF0176 protein